MRYGVDIPDSGAIEFGLNYSVEYHQRVTPIVIQMGIFPREGGLENQDPAYLEDLQTIYRLRNRIAFELREDGTIAGFKKLAERMNF